MMLKNENKKYTMVVRRDSEKFNRMVVYSHFGESEKKTRVTQASDQQIQY